MGYWVIGCKCMFRLYKKQNNVYKSSQDMCSLEDISQLWATDACRYRFWRNKPALMLCKLYPLLCEFPSNAEPFVISIIFMELICFLIHFLIDILCFFYQNHFMVLCLRFCDFISFFLHFNWFMQKCRNLDICKTINWY